MTMRPSRGIPLDSYEDFVRHIGDREYFGQKLGLERIRALLKRLGDPQEKFRSIHIAGTNGKGSTAAMLAAMLQESGYRTGLYTSPHLEDFCERVDPKIVGKRVLETLIMAGALDCFGHDRAAMMAGIERMMGLASRAYEDAALGITDMFGGSASSQQKLHLPVTEPWLPADRLHREFQVVGFYLSAHPLDEYRAALKKMRVQTYAEFSAAVKQGATAGRLAAHQCIRVSTVAQSEDMPEFMRNGIRHRVAMP